MSVFNIFVSYFRSNTKIRNNIDTKNSSFVWEI